MLLIAVECENCGHKYYKNVYSCIFTNHPDTGLPIAGSFCWACKDFNAVLVSYKVIWRAVDRARSKKSLPKE
jgi:hypothetical protein